MCKFKSFIATKNRLYGFVGVDRHSEIKRIAGIKNNTELNINHVNLEFMPPDPISADYEKWELAVDQDLLPDWFVADEWKQKCIDWMNEHTVHDIDTCAGNIEILTGHCEYLLSPGYIGLVLGTVNWAGGTIREIGRDGRVNIVETRGTVDVIQRWGAVGDTYGTIGQVYGTIDTIQPGGIVYAVKSRGTVDTVYGTIGVIETNGEVDVVGIGGIVNIVEIDGTVSKIEPGGTVNKEEESSYRELYGNYIHNPRPF